MSIYVNIELPVKPYVRCFIEHNFDIPVRFYKDKAAMSFVRLLLEKNDHKSDYRPINKNIYSDCLKFQINESDLNHYGCHLSNQAILDLNNFFETKAKEMMRSWIAAEHAFGMPANECVKEFQRKFGFPQSVWKAESIYKDCQRNNIFNPELKKQLEQRIHLIVLSQLSKNRTITKLGKATYEED